MLLAVACGATVANLYYAQPLLDTIARALNVSSGTAGLLVTATQAGYVTGLVLIVPLGDLLQRRRLVSRLLVIDALALAVATVAPSIGVLAAALAVVGVSQRRGADPGAVRVLAGRRGRARPRRRARDERAAARHPARAHGRRASWRELGGWRLIYGLAAGAMLVLAVVLRRALPVVEPPEGGLGYGESAALGRHADPRGADAATADGVRLRVDAVVQRLLDVDRVPALRSRVRLQRGGDRPVLARRAGGRLAMAAIAGRVADAGHQLAGTRFAAAAILAGWGLLALGAHSLAALLAGIVLLDLGVQATQILNQSVIFRLRPEARSRLNTAYMTCYFAGAVSRLGGCVVRVGARRVGRGRAPRVRSSPRSGCSPLALRRERLMVGPRPTGAIGAPLASRGSIVPCQRSSPWAAALTARAARSPPRASAAADDPLGQSSLPIPDPGLPRPGRLERRARRLEDLHARCSRGRERRAPRSRPRPAAAGGGRRLARTRRASRRSSSPRPARSIPAGPADRLAPASHTTHVVARSPVLWGNRLAWIEGRDRVYTAVLGHKAKRVSRAARRSDLRDRAVRRPSRDRAQRRRDRGRRAGLAAGARRLAPRPRAQGLQRRGRPVLRRPLLRRRRAVLRADLLGRPVGLPRSRDRLSLRVREDA